MADVLYVVGTIAFFALMLAYLRACEALGRGERQGTATRGRSHER